MSVLQPTDAASAHYNPLLDVRRGVDEVRDVQTIADILVDPVITTDRRTYFRWHDLRHTWASWLRQSDVPTWVLQELGGGKSGSMVRRYAHMSVKHLAPYADQLIFPVTAGEVEKPEETVTDTGHKNRHSQSRPRLFLVSDNG